MPSPATSLDAQLTAKRKQLRVINEQIAERSKYRSDQEKAITDLVEAGNTQLMGLTHDVELAKKELRDLKTDIRTMARDKVDLTKDLEAMREEAGVGSAFAVPGLALGGIMPT